jgi:hypothetical protein
MKSLFLAGSLLLATSLAWATAVPKCGSPDANGALTVTTLAGYISTYGSTGCLVDDKLFYGFAYSGGAGVTNASGVGVTPLGADPFDPGLRFNAGWSVAAGASGDASIFFNVFDTSGARIEDDSLGLGGVGLGTGGGQLIDVVENACLGLALNSSDQCTGSTQSPALRITAPNSTNTYFLDLNFGGTLYQTLGIEKDILLDGGATTGTSLSIITQNFSEVPEPVGIVLLGTCLAVVAPLLRRKLS